jgi:hypothetical protein
MTIILNCKFGMFDRRSPSGYGVQASACPGIASPAKDMTMHYNARILTQRRRAAESQEDSDQIVFGHLITIQQSDHNASGLCVLAASRLCVEIHHLRVVVLPSLEGKSNHPLEKPPSQVIDYECAKIQSNRIQVNPSSALDQWLNQPVPSSNGAQFTGMKPDNTWQYVNSAGPLCEFMWHGVSAIVTYCRIKSPIVTYGHIFRRIKIVIEATTNFRRCREQPLRLRPFATRPFLFTGIPYILQRMKRIILTVGSSFSQSIR